MYGIQQKWKREEDQILTEDCNGFKFPNRFLLLATPHLAVGSTTVYETVERKDV